MMYCDIWQLLYLLLLAGWRFQLIWCYIDGDLHHRKRAGHHTNYEVSHHMGKMHIKANPDGADFDFSGGDLHVDLHPAHSDVFPIYNYFHSDYHDDHHEPHHEEPHHFEPFHLMYHHHHHSGDDEDHHSHGKNRDDIEEMYGEDNQGETRMQHMHHLGHHDDHHHMHHEHSHQHMPNLFPIGIHHPGMKQVGHHNEHYAHQGMVHRYPYHPGGVHRGEYGHYGGDGCGGHGYGSNGCGKSIVPRDSSDKTSATNLSQRIVPSEAEATMNAEDLLHFKKPSLDFVAEAAKLEAEDKKPALDFVAEAARFDKGTENSGAVLLEAEGDTKGTTRSKLQPPPLPVQFLDANDPPAAPPLKDENARKRSLLKPVSFKGSILDQYKKHWNEEEDVHNRDHDSDDNDDEEDDDNDNYDDDKDEDDDNLDNLTHRHHPKAHHINRKRRRHNHHKFHNIHLEDMPIKSEYFRDHSERKKVYPGPDGSDQSGNASSKSDKAEPIKEVIEPDYKINDKLSAQEAQLALDMEKEKEAKHHHHHRKHRHHHKRHHHHHHRRHKHHHKLTPDNTSDEKEKEIEKQEIEIEKESAKHYKKDEKQSDDDDADDVINSSIEEKGGKHHSHHEESSHHKHEDDEDNEEEGEDDDKDEDDKEDEKEDKESEKEDNNTEDEDDDVEKSHAAKTLDKSEKFKFAGSDEGMDGEERRQHNFHDKLAHKTMHSFHEIEKPHEGEEKFEKDGEEEIDINDNTGEGDKDEESVERKLEEAKARLPLRFGKEAERLRRYGDAKEWGTDNEKEEADREMTKHFEQNNDWKLEGADHDYYKDKPNFNDESENHGDEDHDHEGEHEGGENDHERDHGNEGEEHHEVESPEGEEHHGNAEFHDDGPPPPIETHMDPGEENKHFQDDHEGEDQHKREDEYMGNRRQILQHYIRKTKKSSAVQKDIYASLKEDERAKSFSTFSQPSDRTLYEKLKKEITTETSKPDTSPSTDSLTASSVYAQLKKALIDEQNIKNKAKSNDDLEIGIKTKVDGDDDIIQSPENSKQVDNALLKDFKQRFTEENGFQSIQSADEMLNELQELAITNQKQIDAHQMQGDFYKQALQSKRQELEIASSSKRQYITTKYRHLNATNNYNTSSVSENYIRNKVAKRKSDRKHFKKRSKTRKHKLKTFKVKIKNRENATILAKYSTTPKMS